jgi:hypothetical protein
VLEKVTKRKKEIQDYFLESKNPHEKAMYRFFKNEIKSHDIKIAHIDLSIIGNTRRERRYLCAVWKVPNFRKTIPWIRIGIPYDDISPSLEIVLPVFHGDMPNLWSKGKSYFRLGIEYTVGEHDGTLQFFTNPIGLHDTAEILNVIKEFNKKIKSYE